MLEMVEMGGLASVVESGDETLQGEELFSFVRSFGGTSEEMEAAERRRICSAMADAARCEGGRDLMLEVVVSLGGDGVHVYPEFMRIYALKKLPKDDLHTIETLAEYIDRLVFGFEKDPDEGYVEYVESVLDSCCKRLKSREKEDFVLEVARRMFDREFSLDDTLSREEMERLRWLCSRIRGERLFFLDSLPRTLGELAMLLASTF